MILNRSKFSKDSNEKGGPAMKTVFGSAYMYANRKCFKAKRTLTQLSLDSSNKRALPVSPLSPPEK